MQQPDVGVEIVVQLVMNLQALEEILPFLTKPQRNITPEPLSAYIVYAPKFVPDCYTIQLLQGYSDVPAPYVGSPVNTSQCLHECSN